jgi:pSer/pThr/pTyr-binding forkhead associated (FHA) protein
MSQNLTLTVTEGRLRGKEFVLRESGRYLLGRASCCDLRLPSDADHWTVSRFHCLLDFYAPDVWVLDMGSRNGTFVNNENIAEQSADAPDGGRPLFPERRLFEGDSLRVGNTTFRVSMTEAAADEAAVPEEKLALVG